MTGLLTITDQTSTNILNKDNKKRLITAVLQNFLRVNAQIQWLDKQKTSQARNPLGVSFTSRHDS
jgi:hypothetical protein